jgi:hypothetical protein
LLLPGLLAVEMPYQAIILPNMPCLQKNTNRCTERPGPDDANDANDANDAQASAAAVTILVKHDLVKHDLVKQE